MRGQRNAEAETQMAPRRNSAKWKRQLFFVGVQRQCDETLSFFSLIKQDFADISIQNGSTSKASLLASVNSIGPDEGGWFECEAVNYLGSDSRVIRVDVLGPPTVRRIKPVTFVLNKNEDESALILRCPYSGYPIVNIKWTKAGMRDMRLHI